MWRSKLHSDLPDEMISVIVPTYQHERFVEAALESVYAQTYGPMELVVVDDCSPDETAAVVERWLAERRAVDRFAAVHFAVNAKNRGACDTINDGIAASHGDYVTILNSDDLYGPNRLALLVQAIKTTGTELAFTAVQAIDDVGQRLSGHLLALEIETTADFIEACTTTEWAFLVKNVAVSTGNLFFTRSLYRQLGGFRPLRYCHDWDFAMRALLLGRPTFVNSIEYFYRIHESNSFGCLNLEQFLDPLLVYHHYFAACRAGNVTNLVAMTPRNFPDFFDLFLEMHPGLRGACDLVGGTHVNFDAISKMLLKQAACSQARLLRG